MVDSHRSWPHKRASTSQINREGILEYTYGVSNYNKKNYFFLHNKMGSQKLIGWMNNNLFIFLIKKGQLQPGGLPLKI